MPRSPSRWRGSRRSRCRLADLPCCACCAWHAENLQQQPALSDVSHTSLHCSDATPHPPNSDPTYCSTLFDLSATHSNQAALQPPVQLESVTQCGQLHTAHAQNKKMWHQQLPRLRAGREEWRNQQPTQKGSRAWSNRSTLGAVQRSTARQRCRPCQSQQGAADKCSCLAGLQGGSSLPRAVICLLAKGSGFCAGCWAAMWRAALLAQHRGGGNAPPVLRPDHCILNLHSTWRRGGEHATTTQSTQVLAYSTSAVPTGIAFNRAHFAAQGSAAKQCKAQHRAALH